MEQVYSISADMTTRYTLRMSHTKVIILLALFMAVGVIFIIAGLALASEKYLKMLGDHAKDGKVTGRVSLGFGLVTMLFGLAMYTMPIFINYLIIAYLVLLLILVSVAEIVMKISKRK
jgi:uncharacterized membrane protein HdeD (DUF308 family)